MGNLKGRAAAPVPNDTCPQLVVLDDDPITRSIIAKYFSNEGFQVREAGSAAECRTVFKLGVPDLIFVDIHLPDANGIVFAQEIRAASAVGIVFVTQRDSEVDRVVGLESVGDDYVTKPVNLRELMARARSLLRRRKLEPAPGNRRAVMTFGSYVMDLTRRELSLNSLPIQLTRGEFDLLAALVEANGRPLNRDYLAEVVSSRVGDGDIRTVDSLIARLRRKLKPADGGEPIIVTVTGVGYRFGVMIDPT